jgi:hypothetical protein
VRMAGLAVPGTSGEGCAPPGSQVQLRLESATRTRVWSTPSPTPRSQTRQRCTSRSSPETLDRKSFHSTDQSAGSTPSSSAQYRATTAPTAADRLATRPRFTGSQGSRVDQVFLGWGGRGLVWRSLLGLTRPHVPGPTPETPDQPVSPDTEDGDLDGGAHTIIEATHPAARLHSQWSGTDVNRGRFGAVCVV